MQLRTPPQSIEAEQSVLGGLMLSSQSLWKVQDVLVAADFYRHDHQLIYQAILDLSEKKLPFDAVTLGEWFEARDQAGRVDGGAYLIELASTTPSAANIGAYAAIVAEKALLRRMIEAGTDTVNDGFQPDGRDVTDILAAAQSRIIELQPKQRGGPRLAAETLGEWYDDLQRRYAAGDRMTGLPTPWHAINSATHGLQAGELTMIAARPSMGKSIMGLNLATFTALRGKRVVFFSLEMTRQQCHRRSISALSGVPHDWLLAPHDGEDHWSAMASALRDIKAANLYIDDTSDLTIAQVMARARMLHVRGKLDMIVVDHIHDFKIKAAEARFEVGRIAQGLKTLAKELDIPVIALAQLNRNLASRADKTPNLTDLRESGELEAKGDLILFLHRDDYYDANALPGVVKVILAKGRDIEAGKTIFLQNDYAHMRLADFEGPHPVAPTTRGQPAGDRWT